jgi:ABC-type uncharacterized transport system auxiliary subunit
MNNKNIHHLVILLLLAIALAGCGTIPCHTLQSETIAIYSDITIPANIGISTGTYTKVDGYRYVNVVVEFEQNAANEEPVSLGVIFAHDQNGKLGSRRYFNFEENFTGEANPQMITETGKASWSGSPHNKSTYTARLPIMGPYLQVFPFNHHSAARKFSIVLYLTK